ncbi:hypothetical protein [Bacteroides thetaiotaomicron]|uniref:hypothetical protein n=1 Tax=Bacteroides thetaiotaomicron TaxID=818 RepID=UPI001E34AAF8|nr:hypothetical protein [Bacteroides thetaiotaomicron]MCM1779991.1 hypothetical protein [Bacteroides thetaiotaomicron]MCS2486221.1 hypothetical protein [Bacteroides thetaiotaomicron]MCS2771905.1 hypothetical protein [Bacteroides thetaiotaomicron]MCS3078918.1 hypothetical protein [Bacteroides thetaiotaomicron]MDC2168329.1 hypothetical protein [Bacteroides thetaiotaomicron]
MKRLSLNIMRCFLPVLFVSYLVSITFFAHIHVVNGVTIVHSHPFKKGAAHKHSTVELLLVHFLSHLTTDGAAVVFALSLFIPFLLWRLHGITQHTHYYFPYHGVVALRAPPAIRFSVI